MRIYLIEEIGIEPIFCYNESYILRRVALEKSKQRPIHRVNIRVAYFWRKSKERDIQISRQLDSVHLLFILVRINLDQFDIATLSEFSYVQ